MNFISSWLDSDEKVFCEESNITLFRSCLFNSGAIIDLFQVILIIISIILLILYYSTVPDYRNINNLIGSVSVFIIYPLLKLILNSN